MSTRPLSAALLMAVTLTSACNSNDKPGPASSAGSATNATSATAAASAAAATSAAPATNSERVTLPVTKGVPYRVSNIYSESSLILATGSNDLHFKADNKPEQNYIQFNFKVTGTADVKGHRLLVHHACRFRDVVVARDVTHEDVSTGPASKQELKLDDMLAGGSGIAKSYIWAVPPGLGVATACEATFYDLTLGGEIPKRTELGTVCATSGTTIAARPCNGQELPRDSSEAFPAPIVEWKKDGLIGYFTMTLMDPAEPNERAWQRMLCRAEGEEHPAEGANWLSEEGEVSTLRRGESVVQVFSSSRPFLAKEDASCELSIGIDGPDANPLKAKPKATWCIARSGTKKGPCS